MITSRNILFSPSAHHRTVDNDCLMFPCEPCHWLVHPLTSETWHMGIRIITMMWLIVDIPFVYKWSISLAGGRPLYYACAWGRHKARKYLNKTYKTMRQQRAWILNLLWRTRVAREGTDSNHVRIAIQRASDRMWNPKRLFSLVIGNGSTLLAIIINSVVHLFKRMKLSYSKINKLLCWF